MFCLGFIPETIAQKRPDVQTAALKIKVGVIFKNGDVKPLPRAEFSLNRKDGESIKVEAEKSLNLPPADSFFEYIDSQLNVSRELKEWIKKNDQQNFSAYKTVWKILTINDAFQIPEFFEQLRSFKNPLVKSRLSGEMILTKPNQPPEYPIASGNKENDDASILKYKEILSQYFPSPGDNFQAKYYWIEDLALPVAMKYPNLDYISSSRKAEETRKSMIDMAVKLLTKKYTVRTAKTSFTGEADFEVPAGTYWLSNNEPSSIGSSNILWDMKINLKPGQVIRIELSNDNAKIIF